MIVSTLTKICKIGGGTMKEAEFDKLIKEAGIIAIERMTAEDLKHLDEPVFEISKEHERKMQEIFKMAGRIKKDKKKKVVKIKKLKISKEIEDKKVKLNELVEQNASYDEILKLSQELDKDIADYYKNS